MFSRFETQLKGIIAIAGLGFDLRYHTRASLDHRYGDIMTIGGEYAGHTQLFSYQSFAHGESIPKLQFNLNINTR